jgi:co-chaperonin GroES (HSP10)
MTIQSPLNNIIVNIDTKYIGGISDILRQSQLTPESQLNPADLVNIMSTVVSVPRGTSERQDYKGFSINNIKPGDTAIFRYDVVFSFVKQDVSEEPIYKNEFWYKGKSYWRVDIQKLFAVIRDNKIIMMNGYCMLENMSKASNIILPASMKRLKAAGTAVITHIDNNLTHLPIIDAIPLDTVFYNPLIVQNYKINGKEFGIIKQKDIYGKCPPEYANQEN